MSLYIGNVIQRSETSIGDSPLQEGFSVFPFCQDIQRCHFQSKDRLEYYSGEKNTSGKCEMLNKKTNITLWRFHLRSEAFRGLYKKSRLWLQKWCQKLTGNHLHPSSPPVTHQISLTGKSGHGSRVKAKKGNGKSQVINFIHIQSLK